MQSRGDLKITSGETYKRGDRVGFTKWGVAFRGVIWNDSGGETVEVNIQHRQAVGKSTVISETTQVKRADVRRTGER